MIQLKNCWIDDTHSIVKTLLPPLDLLPRPLLNPQTFPTVKSSPLYLLTQTFLFQPTSPLFALTLYKATSYILMELWTICYVPLYNIYKKTGFQIIKINLSYY
jgi:hypothetical protein